MAASRPRGGMAEELGEVSKPCTPQEVMRIRELYAAGWSQGRLAREFQRTVGTIGRIVRGETHQQLPTIKSDSELASEAEEAKKRFQKMLEEQEVERQNRIAEEFGKELEKTVEMNKELEELKK